MNVSVSTSAQAAEAFLATLSDEQKATLYQGESVANMVCTPGSTCDYPTGTGISGADLTDEQKQLLLDVIANWAGLLTKRPQPMRLRRSRQPAPRVGDMSTPFTVTRRTTTQACDTAGIHRHGRWRCPERCGRARQRRDAHGYSAERGLRISVRRTDLTPSTLASPMVLGQNVIVRTRCRLRGATT